VQLEGTLDKFPLRELIEMVTYSSVTGVLEVRIESEIGQIFFRDGRPYHAVASQLTGIDATSAMFEERDAPFRFVADQESAESTLWQDSWEIIERSEEQARKWLSVRERIPSIECVPALREAPAIGQVQISEMAWPVLAAIDGQRTVQQIAEHLNLVVLDCCLALVFLIDRGLITLQPPRQQFKKPELKRLVLPTAEPTPEAQATSAGATAANPAGGFLERLLAEAQANEQQRPELTDDETQDRKRVYRYVDDRR
jgi:Domain of unknown function (DUF4388)